MPTTLSDLPLVSVSICEPLHGFWTADVEVDVDGPASDADFTGTLSIDIEGVGFVGSVYAPNGARRSGVDAGRWKARLVAGAAAMATSVDARHYVSGNVRGVVEDLLRPGSETLDVEGSDSTVLARVLPSWHRMKGTAAAALETLMESVGSTARMQRDGRLKVGPEAFTEIDFGDDDAPLLDEDPRKRSETYAPLTPLIRPGTAIGGRRIYYVETLVTGGSLRQKVWFEDA